MCYFLGQHRPPPNHLLAHSQKRTIVGVYGRLRALRGAGLRKGLLGSLRDNPKGRRLSLKVKRHQKGSVPHNRIFVVIDRCATVGDGTTGPHLKPSLCPVQGHGHFAVKVPGDLYFFLPIYRRCLEAPMIDLSTPISFSKSSQSWRCFR